MPAHWALVGLLVRENKPADADKALEALKVVAPKHPKTFYYEALVRASQRNYAAARDAIQQELALVADDPVGTVLAAAIDFELHDYVHAESTLVKALSRAPQNDFARRLLVSTYLQMRQPAKALEALKPMLGRIDKDPVMQSVAGEVYLQNGDPAQAADYFETSATLDPKAARAKTGLAMTRLAQGDTAGRRQGARGRIGRRSGRAAGPDADLGRAAAPRVGQGAGGDRRSGKEAAESAARRPTCAASRSSARTTCPARARASSARWRSMRRISPR